ncbi:hypothetical protein AU210_016360 [Fusarium oxysporum f. sp. radicis-cucumerinum]|uniref:Uncharacterized protein n=1 Tax=Fusarium oxysporum f. sp. radicis-cucumerinum TaxID=327505 RepID=A0A2H3FP20_FUSOX|nr:hypothetical protein AU210_016360 [Fusarium oxysporum f. sp. radicis-cucumerinum]
MDEPYEWTYILNKAEHTFSILFQSGCYSHPDIFSVLASTCMGELQAIWHKCKAQSGARTDICSLYTYKRTLI